MLSNIASRLQEWQRLDAELLEGIENVIAARVRFLLRPSNYQKENNHGVSQAAALIVAGHTFSSLDGAGCWISTGRERLHEVVDLNVADDGVQIEQSPFYYFYVLSFLADINTWNQQVGAFEGRFLADTVAKMADFSTRIVSPDGSVPLIGSSLAHNVLDVRPHLVDELSQVSPAMAWMASAGNAGEMPTSRGVFVVENKLVVVLDQLDSGSTRSFSQKWHLPPTVDVNVTAPNQALISDADQRPLLSIVELGSRPQLQVEAGFIGVV